MGGFYLRTGNEIIKKIINLIGFSYSNNQIPRFSAKKKLKVFGTG